MAVAAAWFCVSICGVYPLLQGQSLSKLSREGCDLPYVAGQGKAWNEVAVKPWTLLLSSFILFQSLLHLLISLFIPSSITSII